MGTLRHPTKTKSADYTREAMELIRDLENERDGLRDALANAGNGKAEE